MRNGLLGVRPLLPLCRITLTRRSYYHTDSSPYTAKIAQHWQLADKAPWMASGVWTWSRCVFLSAHRGIGNERGRRFWTALPFTFATVRASMKASKDPTAGVRAVMTTIWGDEGNEVSRRLRGRVGADEEQCDLYSALPGMLYQAEHAYTTNDEVDATLLRRKFDGITGGDFDDYVYASKIE